MLTALVQNAGQTPLTLATAGKNTALAWWTPRPEAERLAQTRGWSIVADLNMYPFAEYRRLLGRLKSPMIYDVELGRNMGVPPPWSAVALYTDDQNRFVASGGRPVVFRARVPLLDRLAPGPYLQTTVVPAARVRPARRRR